MKGHRFKSLTVPALALGLAAVASPAPAASKFSHDDWNKVVGKFVDAKGYVNYEALGKDRADLDRYLAAIRKTGPKTNIEMFPTSSEKLSYYLNAYNATVFDGVVARGPEKKTVWGGGLLGIAFFREDRMIGGEKTSLYNLENDVVREVFKDPRVHAALNCASKGCPRLPQEAYEPEKLDEQLNQGISEFVAEDRNVKIDDTAKTVWLSKIFDWFKKDFVGYEKAKGINDPSQIDYVNRYRGSLPKVPRDYKVKFFEYDKSINAQ